MNLRNLLIWSPTIIGAILLLVSQVDLHLFSSGIFGVRTILGWELALVLLGFFVSLLVFLYGIHFLFKKRWVLAINALINPVFFLVLFTVGGALGAAYLKAT
ncbi:MAG: hypothetical protein ACKVJE_12395 [Pseudomonadales bacterium]